LSILHLPQDAMQRFVARKNIEHYQLLLKRETDPAKRETLLKLLAEEEAKFGDPEMRGKTGNDPSANKA
jgi:hypothetical protein